MLVKDILEEFIFDCEIRKLSPRTIKSYTNNTKGFLRFIEVDFDIIDIQEIKSIHIKKYLIYLVNKNLTESYINSVLKCLRAFIKYAIGEEYIEINPTKKLQWQREGKRLIKTFSDDEVKRMLKVFKHSDFLNSRNKIILSMLLDTGIRNLELCQLQKSSIKDDYFTIVGKGNKERHIAISPYLKKEMIKYDRFREYFFKDRYIKYNNYFLSRSGKPLTVETVERIVKIAGEEANIRKDIRCSPHTCRHYVAQRQLKNGLDVYSLSRILGHERIEITKRYLQSLEDKDIIQMSIGTSPLMNL